MPRGQRHLWTREELEKVLSASGVDGHAALAEELGVTANTIYSTRSRVRVNGGIDEFLEMQGKQASYGTKVPQTLAEQLGRVYVIRLGAAGRAGQHPQYTVTLPPILTQRFIEKYGREVRFVPTDEGILIQPVPRSEENGLPSWVTE